MDKKEQNKLVNVFSIENKRGQMELSFGMIFSIILVVLFISFATYVIITFLSFLDDVKTKQFQQEVQDSIDDIWNSPQGSKQVSYSLPTSIKKICFFDKKQDAKGLDKDLYNLFLGLNVKENLMFYPENSGNGKNGIFLDHLNLENITSKNNPNCFENNKGKITINLKMNYGENLVTIS
jgi:hypothetical protein